MDIAALAEQICQKYNISLGELCTGSRRRVVVEARGSIFSILQSENWDILPRMSADF
jgi:hypothetical protein